MGTATADEFGTLAVSSLNYKVQCCPAPASQLQRLVALSSQAAHLGGRRAKSSGAVLNMARLSEQEVMFR